MARWLVVLLPLALLVGGVGYEIVQVQRSKPPESVTSFERFREWQPAVHEVRIIHVGTEQYLDAIGPMVGFLPSDRSSYVFGRDKTLKWWTHDIGDDSFFQQDLDIYQSAERIDIRTAQRWLDAIP